MAVTRGARTEAELAARPGSFEVAPAVDGQAAVALGAGIWMSAGTSNSYAIETGDGTVVVNTGLAFEGDIHRAAFDAAGLGPYRVVVLTQHHADHVGGIAAFEAPGVEVVAHRDLAAGQEEHLRLLGFRARRNVFFPGVTAAVVAHGGRSLPPRVVEPTTPVTGAHSFELGGRRVEVRAVHGAETADSLLVWLPDERVLLTGNALGTPFPDFPNLSTIRGDRYRRAADYLVTLRLVRRLAPVALVTGHFDPIVGAGLVDRAVARIERAVEAVHDAVVDGMNAGRDLPELMRTVGLPPDGRVGEVHGKVSWGVRAVWEEHAGSFRARSTTELYDVEVSDVAGDLVGLAGAGPLVAAGGRHLAAGRPLHALHLAELVRAADPDHDGARALALAAHERLRSGAGTNVWETRWLDHRIASLRAEAGDG